MSKIITTQYEQTDLNFIIDHASYSIVYDAHKSHSMVNNTWCFSFCCYYFPYKYAQYTQNFGTHAVKNLTQANGSHL